jgi:tetratricopeptide (TPR) repeat protein
MIHLLLIGALALSPVPFVEPLPAVESIEVLVAELFAEESPERLLERADKLLLDKRCDDDLRSLLQVYRGSALETLGGPEDARAAYDKAVEFDPNSLGGHAGSGSCSMDLHDYSRAIDSFHRALALAPDRSSSRANLGLAHVYREEWSSAKAAFVELKRRDPSSLWGWAGEGIVFARQGRAFDAWFCLQRVLDLDPEHDWVGSLELSVQRSRIDDEAFRLVVGAMRNPEEPDRWRAASARLFALREPLQALALSKRWLEARPGELEARRHVALDLYACRFPAEAAAVARQIVAAHPDDLWIGLVRHAALVELDMRQLADASLRGQLGGVDPDPWLVALAHYRVGEIERAEIDALVEATEDEDLRTVRVLEEELFAPEQIAAADPNGPGLLEMLARGERCAALAPLAEAVVRARPDSLVAALGAGRSTEPTWPLDEELVHWLDAVPAGYVVQLPARSFTMTEQLFMRDRTGLHLRGRTDADGAPTTRLYYSNPSASEAVASFLDCDDLTLESVWFEHAEEEVSATRESVVRLMSCEGATLRNCRFARGKQGVYARGVTDLVVDGSRIENTTQAGLWLDGVTGISITGTRLFDYNISWMGEGNAGPFHEKGNMLGLYNVWHPELEGGTCR